MADDEARAEAGLRKSPLEDNESQCADSKEQAKKMCDGPCKNRGCTDIIWCLLFIAHIGMLVVLFSFAVADGDPSRVWRGADYQGNMCGAKGEMTEGNVSLKEYGFVYYSMNTQTTFDKVAGNMFPKTVSASGLQDSAAAAAKLAQDMQSDPTAAMSSMGGSPNSLVSELTKYLTPVCVKACPTVETSKSRQFDSSNPAHYWPKDGVDQTKWQALGKPTGMFNQDAYSLDFCPYPEKYCVEMPGVPVENVMGLYCIPAAVSENAGAATDAVKGAATKFIPPELFESIGGGFADYMADIQNARWVILLTSICGIVLAMVFLILLRIFLAPIVYLSILATLLGIVGGGLALFIMSTQCAGTTLVGSGAGLAAGVADQAVASATNAVNGTFAVNTTAIAPDLCPEGYALPAEANRTYALYGAYVVWGIAGVYLIILICSCKRIRLAVAVNKVAAQFIGQNPGIITLPLFQMLFVFIWWIIWIIVVAFVVSYVPPGGVEDAKVGPCGDLLTSCRAYEDTPAGCVLGDAGCVRKWIESSILPEKDAESMANQKRCYKTGTAYLTDDGYWQCKGVRMYMDYQFWYCVFSLFWMNAMCVAMGQMTIAGTVGSWYFGEKKVGTGFLRMVGAAKTAVRYHLGTMAFGSFILAVIKTVKWFLRYLAEQQKRAKNKVAEMIFKAIACCLACLEKCIEFLNKNAYIQCALNGTNFCVSAKNAFLLILRNCARIGILAALGFITQFLGKIFICVGTAFIGYQLLYAMDDGTLNSPVMPVVIFVIIGYILGAIVMQVFAMAVDTILQCFVAEEETSGGAGKNTPEALKSMLPKPKA